MTKENLFTYATDLYKSKYINLKQYSIIALFINSIDLNNNFRKDN